MTPTSGNRPVVTGTASQTFEEFHESRLVALYDAWGERRADAAFYASLAAELAPQTVLDVGCGTGEIACLLAGQGYRVTGVDPSSTMLEVARHRPGGHLVRWIEGDASAFDDLPADLALMTGHVAQVIVDEDVWRSTLAAIREALAPGGHLAFESRNPTAEEWRRWTPRTSRRRLHAPGGESVDAWFEVQEVRGDVVRTTIRYRFAGGSEATSTNELRFRSPEQISHALQDSGFDVRWVFGDWDRSPVRASSPELIVVAMRG